MSNYTSKYTGQEIDAGIDHSQSSGNPHGTNLAQVGGSNPTFIINGDFRNPVNQRVITNGQTISNGYSIDQWKAYNLTFVTLDSTGITVRPSSGVCVFSQIIENGYNKFNGKVLTFSMLIDGTMYVGTGTCNLILGSSCTVVQAAITGGSEFIDIFFDGANLMCRYVSELSTARKLMCSKLELGSVSTLANDPPSDDGEQLAKCQRYFVRFNYPQYACISIASSDTGYIMYSLSLATALRIGNPTLSITCSPTRSSDALTLADVTINTTSAGMVTLGKLYSGAAQSSTIFAASAGHIDLSADL